VDTLTPDKWGAGLKGFAHMRRKDFPGYTEKERAKKHKASAQTEWLLFALIPNAGTRREQMPPSGLGGSEASSKRRCDYWEVNTNI